MAKRSAAKKTANADRPADAPKSSPAPYTVLARRYRPQQFEECLGQEPIAKALVNAIEHNRVGHAYLFTGSRGVGKTSIARIFAKALNCEQGPSAHPCDACETCRAIAAGEDIDVLEIDGASNRGIDEVRALRAGVNFRPTRGRYKIYIIDEVHMLSKDAFNALLKTLEEPPPHAKFFFATTEVQKIPITILSRCQRFDLAGIDQEQIQSRLAEICREEGVEADEEAIELIARRAAGSMRDSQSLLDQLLAFGGDRLTAADVQRLLGTAGEERVLELARALAAGDAGRCLELVEAAVAAGIHLGEWTEQMLSYFRDVLVLSVDPKGKLLSLAERHREELSKQARAWSHTGILERMDLLAACRLRMRTSTFSRTLLEMTLVRMCRLDEFLDLSREVPSSAGSASTANVRRNLPPSAQASAAPRYLSTSPVRAEPPPASNVREAPDGASANSPGAPNQPSPEPTFELTPASAHRFFALLLEQLDDMVLSNMLRQARVELRSPDTLVLLFERGHSQSYAHASDPARQARVEEVARRLAGRKVTIRAEQSREPEAGASTAARTSAPQLKDRAAKMPLVRRAEQRLEARLIDVVLPKSPGATEKSADEHAQIDGSAFQPGQDPGRNQADAGGAG